MNAKKRLLDSARARPTSYNEYHSWLLNVEEVYYMLFRDTPPMCATDIHHRYALRTYGMCKYFFIPLNKPYDSPSRKALSLGFQENSLEYIPLSHQTLNLTALGRGFLVEYFDAGHKLSTSLFSISTPLD